MSIQSSIIPAINKPKIKVCIAVPTKDTLYAHFAYCLQDLVKYNTITGIDSFVEFNMGTLIGNQREKLATKAIEADATHILWLDSDMMFPKNTCEILLSHELPFVACNYSTRALPLKSVSYSVVFNWESMIPDDSTGLVLVEGVGFGCVMTSTELFRQSRKPWFPITYSKNTDDYLGEDMNFCLKVSEMGYPMFVDADLSRKIYHIGTTAFSLDKHPIDTPE